MTSSSTKFTHRRASRCRALPAAILAALVAMGGVAHAGAQAVPSARDASQPADAGVDNPDRSEQAIELGTVEVTATGRAEQAVDVPYNISVVTGDSIRKNHIRNTAELFRGIPGVNVVDSGPRNSSTVNNIRIRGINVDSSAMGDYALMSVAPVATYVDSVPLYANFLLFDINRVEVLRGPQGTLYGSGSLGGTVRYLLNKPQLGQFNGTISGSLSSAKYSSSIGNSESLVLNIPLGQTMALRIDALRNDYPGVTDYVNLYTLDDDGLPVAPAGVLAPDTEYHAKADADTVEQAYGRVALRWKPSDGVDVQLSYMAQADRFGSRRGTSMGVDGYGDPYERFQLGAVQLEPSNRHVHLTSLEANIDVGFATLTSSTSYYNHEGDVISDNTGFYAKLNWYSSLYYNYPRPMSTAARSYGDRALTQEFRLVSKQNDVFDYIVGLYFRNQHTYSTQTSQLRGFKRWWDTALPTLASLVDSKSHDYHYVAKNHYKETALYGQGTWHVTDALDLTVGLRTFRDTFSATVDSALPLWVGLFPPGHATEEQDNSKTLFYGNMSYWLNDRNQFYATVSQGYRRGGSNGVPTTGYFAEDPSWLFYQPDTVLNYEAGFKGIVGSLTYTADVFVTNWSDPQLNTSTTNWGFFAVQNMGAARSKGVEFELRGQAGPHFTYGLGYAYTDAELTEDAYTPIGTLISPAGTQLPGVSKHRVNASGTYSFPVGPGLMSLHVDGSYQSDSQNSISQSPSFNYTLPGFTIWNASLNYNLSTWTLSLWMKNVTNQKGITGVYTTAYMGTEPSEGFYGNGSKAINTLPRTIGATATYWF